MGAVRLPLMLRGNIVGIFEKLSVMMYAILTVIKGLGSFAMARS